MSIGSSIALSFFIAEIIFSLSLITAYTIEMFRERHYLKIKEKTFRDYYLNKEVLSDLPIFAKDVMPLKVGQLLLPNFIGQDVKLLEYTPEVQF